MEIIPLNEENIYKYHLVDRLGKTREELIDMIEDNWRTDHISFVYLDKRLPRQFQAYVVKEHCPRIDEGKDT